MNAYGAVMRRQGRKDRPDDQDGVAAVNGDVGTLGGG